MDFIDQYLSIRKVALTLSTNLVLNHVVVGIKLFGKFANAN